MPSRLSDLLERIRPAGAPGAATEATTQRARAAAEEIGAVTVVLAGFDEAARDVVAAARAEAVTIRAAAEHEARRIAAERPDRVAEASSAQVVPPAGAEDEEPARLAIEAQRRIAELRAATGARADPVVRDALAAVWGMVTPARAEP